MNLRELGIYLLPNGRELVFTSDGDGKALYSLEASHNVGHLQYVLDENGRLLCERRLTAWDITNLLDTGRTLMRG